MKKVHNTILSDSSSQQTSHQQNPKSDAIFCWYHLGKNETLEAKVVSLHLQPSFTPCPPLVGRDS